jgi:WD40 repeat protein
MVVEPKSQRTILNIHDCAELITSLSFSPDSRLIAATTRGENVHIWDAQTGTREATLAGHRPFASCLDFSPDGQMIAVGSLGKFHLWSRSRKSGWAGEVVPYPPWWIDSVSFSKDGALLAIITRPELACWDLKNRRKRGAACQAQGGLKFGRFTADGNWIVTAGFRLQRGVEYGEVCYWNTVTRKCDHNIIGLKGDMEAVSFNQDGSLLAGRDVNCNIWLWDVLFEPLAEKQQKRRPSRK